MRNETKINQIDSNQKPDALIGTKVVFAEGNKITMYQDFRWHRSVPDNVEFEVESVVNKQLDVFWLMADGYGCLSVPGKYGNGKIAVHRKDILEAQYIK